MRFYLVLFFLCAFHVLAADPFYCPMKCEGAKTYAKMGQCPICGMDLEKKIEGAAPSAMSSLEFRIDLSASPPFPPPHTSTKLVFTPRQTKDNSVLKALAIVHEKPMHAILVSQDLSWYSHEHPELQSDGSLVLNTAFPFAGNFIFYIDFTPKDSRNQVVPLAFKVDGKVPPRKKLSQTADSVRKIGTYSVSLKMDPMPKAGTPITLTYSISEKGKAVKDLENYLGAKGHLVFISEDTLHYIHAHPPHHSGHGNTQPEGPASQFVSVFPKPGLYKGWMQFQHRGKVQTVDHTLRVN